MDAGDAIRQTSRVISHIKIPMLMRLSRLLLVTLLIGFAVLPSLHAQDQTAAAPSAPASPYSVIVPVTDPTPAQRDAAFSSALVQVLTRIAGGSVAAAAGVICLAYGVYGWAAFFLVIAALNFAGGYWYLSVARSAPART